MKEEKTTLDNILNAAKKEFLAKGFKTSSLRAIVKAANVTTGAFYGYFKSKEELFDMLVEEQYKLLLKKYKQAQSDFSKLTPEQQKNGVGEISGECMTWMTEYVYENKDAFKLLLCCSEGTKYENMIHEMVEIEIDATHAFAKILKDLGSDEYKIDLQLEHILVSGMFSAFFELIIHDVPYENAKQYVQDLRMFYTAGWQKIMGF